MKNIGKHTIDTKKNIADAILAAAKDNIIEVTTKAQMVILADLFSHQNLFDKIFQQVIKTKENSNGTQYNNDWYVALKLIKWKLWDKNGKLDVYAWPPKKAAEKLALSKRVGYGSLAGWINMHRLLFKMKDKKERKILRGYFGMFRFDFREVFVPAEKRSAIVLTRELIDTLAAEGITYCINSYENYNEKTQSYAIQELIEGDILILEYKEDGIYVYRIERAVFDETYDM